MRRSLCILCLFAVSSLFAAQAAFADAFILCYHSFKGEGESTLDFSPEAFKAQLDKFESLGYRFVGLDDAVAGRTTGRKNIVITIDDGNHTIPPVVRQELLARGIKPTLFVSASLVKRHKFTIKPDVLKALVSEGAILGCHGFTHEYMTPHAWGKDPKKVEDEVVRPTPYFTEWFGKIPEYFAYPFGIACPEAEALVKKAGYAWGFLADDKLAAVNFSDPALDRWGVPRAIVYKWTIDRIYRQLAAVQD